MNEHLREKLMLLQRNPRVWFGLTVVLLIILAALLAPWLTPFQPTEMDISLRLLKPNATHWLGCDLDGTDIFTSMLYGARISLYISFLTVLVCVSLGLVLGLLSGYWGGVIDTVIMRIVDMLMALPSIIVAMVLAALLGPSIYNIVLAIAVTGWTSSARLVRGQVLSLKEREYVLASRALGAKDLRIIVKHILPFIWTPLVVQATFSLAGIILIEASLSFLGLGAESSVPTWGALLGQGRNVLTAAPHLSIAPGLAIMFLVLALNFLGDALRDVLDPKQAKSF